VITKPHTPVRSEGEDSVGHQASVQLHEHQSNRFDHHRQVFGQVPHVIVVVTPDGTITDVSPGLTQWLGWTDTDLIGKSAFDFIHPGDHQLVAIELIREITEPNQPAPSLVLRALRSDSTWCDVEILGKNLLDDPLVNGVSVSIRYVTGPCLSQRVLAAGDYLYQSVSTTASDGTTIFDAAGKRVYTSSSLCAMLGYSTDEIKSVGPGEFVYPPDTVLWRTATREVLRSSGGVVRCECRVIKKDGTLLWIEVTVVNLLTEAGVNGIVVHVRDIHERRCLQQELMHRASIDDLTGIANRAAFVERTTAMEANRVRRTLLFCDLDGFKSVNDVFGHAEGDRLLAAIGQGLRSALSADALVARIGGDEFCVLMEFTGEDEAVQCARTVIATVAKIVSSNLLGDNVDHESVLLRVGVSVGIASDAADLHDSSSLLSRADNAMYESKRSGCNQITFAM
jgi:diguanylate cyclase (GGDEF)-like protein/PAS domain S-box-containing protein